MSNLKDKKLKLFSGCFYFIS